MSTTSWVDTTLGEVAEIVGGATPKTSVDDYWDGDVYWATPKDLSELEGAEIDSTPRTLTQAGLRSCSAQVLPPGSVLLSSRAPIGHVAINTVPMATNQGFKSLVPYRDRVDAKFLYWWLRRNRPALEAMGTGATFKEISKKTTTAVPIKLPPIEEQRRIAEVLDAADELRAKRRETLTKLDTLTQAIFIDMFGDPVTNPRGWDTAPLGDLGTLDRGVSKHRPRNDPALLGGPWPLVQTGDVATSRGYIRAAGGSYSDFGLAQSRLWPAGTLCITIAANIAKTGILTFDACFPDSVVGFTSDPATTEFVRAFLGFLQPVLEANAPESAQKNINLKTLRTADAPLPPSALREQFAEAVDAVRVQHSLLTGSGESFDELFASLQQRAFRGEL